MLEKIQACLDEITRKFGDRRVCHCEVAVNGRYTLSGSVLDEETLTAVADHLATHFPNISFNSDAVHVLRRPNPRLMAISTNLAGLHVKPSRRYEMISQLLNGWRVECLKEENDWAYVRQPDGYLGWVQAGYLTDAEPQSTTHMVSEPIVLLYERPGLAAGLAGRVVGGTAVTVTNTQAEWVELTLAGGLVGWTVQANLRELESLRLNQPDQMIQDAAKYIGVPYRWGGISALGIDCSGLAQLLHRQIGIQTPRDADMQFDAGHVVEPAFQPGDLLYFGSDKGHRSISHVGMSLGGWRMIHSSGSRNGVYEDDVQGNEWLRTHFLGGRRFI
ncbi:MAG: C40 family peptidase [Methylococcales bacterium]|nr:C40 family peptidase [Methylococcales bacterium]